MLYIQRYRSPLGEILMAADDAGLVGLWFAGQKHFAPGLTQAQEQETPVLAAAMVAVVAGLWPRGTDRSDTGTVAGAWVAAGTRDGR